MLLFRKYAFAAIATTLLFAACKKDNDMEPNLPDASYMTATIDGSYWTATDVYRTTQGGDTVRFTGSRNNSSKAVTIQLVINKYRGPGSYPLNDTAASAVYTDNTGIYKSYGGSITISADDATHIKAGFQIGADGNVAGTSVNITNGQLNVKK